MCVHHHTYMPCLSLSHVTRVPVTRVSVTRVPVTLFCALSLAGKRGVGTTAMQGRRLCALGISLQEETHPANPARTRVLHKSSGARSNTLRGCRLHGGTLPADSRLSAVLLCLSSFAKSGGDAKDRYADAKTSLFVRIGNSILSWPCSVSGTCLQSLDTLRRAWVMQVNLLPSLPGLSCHP